MTPISANRKRVPRALGVSRSINLPLLRLDPWPCWPSGLLATGWRKAWRRGKTVANPPVFLFPQCCEAIYSSVSGLKAHLANCTKVGPASRPFGSEVGLGLAFWKKQAKGQNKIKKDVG